MAGIRRPWVAQRLPGDVVLHPVAIVALAVLLLNDHVLKRLLPGFVTGKLSDVAAMLFCPLLLAAVYEVLRAVLVGRGHPMPLRIVITVCFLVAGGFAAMKLNSSVGDFYGRVVGQIRGLLGGEDLPVFVAHDATDALAALIVPFPAWLLKVRARYDLRSPAM